MMIKVTVEIEIGGNRSATASAEVNDAFLIAETLQVVGLFGPVMFTKRLRSVGSNSQVFLWHFVRRTWASDTRTCAFCTTRILGRRSLWRSDAWDKFVGPHHLWDRNQASKTTEVQHTKISKKKKCRILPPGCQVEPAKSPTRVNILQQLTPQTTLRSTCYGNISDSNQHMFDSLQARSVVFANVK